MAEPEIAVSITGYAFTIDDLREFIDACTSLPGMVANADVYVQCEPHDGLGAARHTITATTGSKQ